MQDKCDDEEFQAALGCSGLIDLPPLNLHGGVEFRCEAWNHIGNPSNFLAENLVVDFAWPCIRQSSSRS